MPKEILTRCGYRCDLCLAYIDNIKIDDQREFLSETWHKIYGFKIPADRIRCDGCISNGHPETILIDSKCPVRPCVIEKGLENCAQCEGYPCDIFNSRKVIYEEFIKDIRASRKEYLRGIKPYENKKRLDALRTINYPNSRLLNPEIIPDDDSIVRFIGAEKTGKVWLDLLTFLDTSYKLDRKIVYGGRKYGWTVQYKKSKKTLITCFPERNSFTVLLIFGKSELDKIHSAKAMLSSGIYDQIENTRQYHDGKWVWFRIETDQYVKDIIELIKIKRKPEIIS